MSISRRSLRAEAWRNVTSGTARAGLLACAWCLLVAGLLAWNVTTTRAVLVGAEQYRSAGASVIVVEADAQIDGAQCESVGGLANVRNAGAVRTAERSVVPDVTPGVAVPTFDVTPGVTKILMNEPERVDGILLSAQAAEALGTGQGRALQLDGRPVDVAGTFAYPDDGRRAGLGYSVVQTVVPEGAFDQCWIEMWPESAQVRSIVSSLVLSEGGSEQSPPSVGQLNPSLGSSFNGEARYRGRATAYLPEILVAASVALGFVSVRLRRLELAAARLVGIKPLDQCYQLLVEFGLWLTIASVAMLGLAAGTAFLALGGAALPSLQYSLATVVASGLGVLVGGGFGLASVGSRSAFAYFRDR